MDLTTEETMKAICMKCGRDLEYRVESIKFRCIKNHLCPEHAADAIVAEVLMGFRKKLAAIAIRYR